MPDNLEVHGLLAECHLDSSDVVMAWRELKDDAPAVENPTLWWRALGHCAFEAKQWPEAVSALRHAVLGNPNDFEAAYMLGIAAQRLGIAPLADRELERARTTEKMSAVGSILLKTNRSRQDLLATSLLSFGRLLLELRRPREALPWLAMFLTMRPNHDEALSLWERANSSAHSEPDRQNAVIDPQIVAKIGSSIAATDRKVQQQGVLQQASTTGQTPIRLRDIHKDVGLDFQYFNGRTSNNYILETVGGGVAVLDYDSDGWPDIFFPNGRHLEEGNGAPSAFSDELFRNIDGTRVNPVTQLARVSSREFGQGCVACDYNNDGFQDLLVGTFGRVLAYQNQGDGTFVETAKQIGIAGSRWTSSLAMADLDRDGDLDLYVVNYVKEPFLICRDDEGRPLTCSPANFDAEQDLLYLNEGNGSFRDVTDDAGILAPDGKGLGVVIADLDNDGWQDIYVANDGEQNFLFRNKTALPGGDLQFAEVGLASGSAVSRDARAQAGMGIACDDFDNNGWLDLYVTNFVEDYNTYYRNHGDALFSDETEEHALVKPTMKALGFGVQSVDLDLDGRGELVVANGPIHNEPIEGTPWRMRPHCFQRMPGGAYKEISGQVGDYFQGKYIGRAVARLDFNQDHLPDVVAVHQDRPAALLVNETRQVGHALVLRLCGVQSNRDAIGARIEFTTGSTPRLIEVTAGDGYCASNERTLIIGVGAAKVVPKVTIRWPSGHVDEFTDVPSNASLLIVEDQMPSVLPSH